MSLEFAHGDLGWATGDTVGTTFTVSGLSFSPKALMFVVNGQADSTDANTITRNARLGIGFATSTSDRRCMAVASQDGVGTSNCSAAYRDDCVVVTLDTADAVDGRLDLNSITSDGFTLIVDEQLTADNIRVFWYAWGGSDITNMATGEISEPAATGNQSYTVTGSFQPTVVMFSGCQLSVAPPTAAAQDAGLMFGAATGTGIGNQFVCTRNEDTGSNTMDTDKYSITTECLAMITIAGGNPNARAAFNGFDSVGFDLDWLARAVTGRRYIYLAIQGGAWKVSSTTGDPSTIGNTITISDIPFPPIGAILATHGAVEDAAGVSTPQAKLSIGCWSSLSSRRAMGSDSLDGSANAEIALAIEYDQIIVIPDVAGGIVFSLDIDAINSNGFRMITDDAGGGALTLFPYVAFGSVPAQVPYQPWVHRGPVLAQ